MPVPVATTTADRKKKTTPRLAEWMLAFTPLAYAEGRGATSAVNALLDDGLGRLGKQAKGDRHAIKQGLKPILAQGRDMLAKEFRTSNDGAAYLGGHTMLVDRIIAFVYGEIGDTSPSKLSVIATGGYGRGELSPYSDIDLLFLTEDGATTSKASNKVIEYILYVLWDLGLQVGHACRSISQTVVSAQSDITIRTSLLDMRHLLGDSKLTARLKTRFASEVMADTRLSFIDAKIKERDARHLKSHAHRYMLEPNIKDGKGGLRDLHTLFWIARYAYAIDSVADMVRLGVLSQAEARGFSSAQRFLWSLRCHMHLREGRAEDRLSFDVQQALAPQFGFATASGTGNGDALSNAQNNARWVEGFMRRYFLAATMVGNLTRIFCADIEDRFTPPVASHNQTQALPAPFVAHGGRIALAKGATFAANPAAMLAVFKIALDSGLDMHPDTLRALTRRRHGIDPAFCADSANNAMFLSILTHKRKPERVLRLMNEVGVLGKFIPDFASVVARMQFNTYHSYTVDEHTIHAIGVLNDIEQGQLKAIAPLASAAVHEIVGRTELYVALLLHDIAKGQSGDHSVLGEEVARKLAPRFGLEEAGVETVAWLVRNHLLMSDTAFRYDLSDATVIDRFAEAVRSPERLNLLLVLTVADIRAVGPNVWNDWKAQLMRELYTRSMQVLLGAEAATLVQLQASSMAEDLAADLRGQGKGWDEAAISQHIDGFPASYWSAFDRSAYARYAQLFMDFATRGEAAVFCLTPDKTRGATELAVITADDAGLFARISGGVVAAGADIVDARITTRKDGLTLDVLWLQDQDKSAISDASRLKQIENSLRAAVTGKLNIGEAVERRWRQTPARIRARPERARVLLNNHISRTHTVLEINGKDAPGLLYRVSYAMADMGLQIQMATVSTYGDRVVDVFYIKDAFGLKIDQPSRMKSIRTKLLRVLEDSDPANKVMA